VRSLTRPDDVTVTDDQGAVRPSSQAPRLAPELHFLAAGQAEAAAGAFKKAGGISWC
jgi:hypothetical protein